MGPSDAIETYYKTYSAGGFIYWAYFSIGVESFFANGTLMTVDFSLSSSILKFVFVF